MKKLNIIKILLLVMCCFIHHSYAAFNVSAIYIEGQGNNIYEAEIKAHHQGMARAFLLVLDKLGISDQDVEEVPYTQLQKLFRIHNIKNIVTDDKFYKATVSYDYELTELNKLLLNYGNSKVQGMFYEYLVIPIFKQKDVLTLWTSQQEWHKKWSNSRGLLDNAKLFYPKPLGVKSKINSDNVLKLSYDDFINLFPELLIKKVLLIICEYFTDIQNGATVMEVRYVVIGDHGKDLVTRSYPLNSLNAVASTTANVLEATITEYGKLKVNKEINLEDSNIQIMSQPVKEDDIRTVILNFDAFTEEELNSIKAKLSQVSCIENWKIFNEYKEKYKITISTKVDDYKLAEELYLNKLSFKKMNNIYFLINVITEGN